jgi:hypothetical protein
MRRSIVVMAGVAALVALAPWQVARGSTPSDGTITPTSPSVTWTGPTWPAGATAVAQRGVQPTCPPQTADPAHLVCDHYALTVNVSSSYWQTSYGGVRITATWPDNNNKLEVAVYDAAGNFVGWGLGGGASTVVIPVAQGTYDVIVVPEVVVQPTSYTATAEIVPLSAPSASPSLGGPSAYRATPVASEDLNHPPVNTTARYNGPELQLAAHPVGHPAMEPTLGVDKSGTVFMNVRDAITVVPGVETRHEPYVYKSSDGGATWTEAGDTLSDAWHTGTDDPYLYVDPDYGRVFWIDLLPFGAPAPPGATLSYTDDRGAAWTNTEVGPPGLNDHETIATGVVPDGLPTLDPAFPKAVYYCVNQLTDVGCERSLDGGRTWLRVGSPLLNQTTACAVSTTDHLSTDPQGRVFLGSSGCDIPIVAMSADGGVTWNNVTVTTGILAAYHDVATAEDTAGNVYALFADQQFSLPFLSVSRDHGATWSTPVMIAPPDVHETGMLTLQAGTPGRVAIGMVTTTVDNQGDAGRPWSYRMTITEDALDASPLFVSNVTTLPDVGTAIVNRGECCNGMADFLDLKKAPLPGGPVWGSLSDPCTATCITDRNAANNLSSGMGYAIQQTAGPALMGPDKYLPGSRGTHTVAAAVAAVGVIGLPDTAPAFPERWSGAALLALVLCGAAARRRRCQAG